MPQNQERCSICGRRCPDDQLHFGERVGHVCTNCLESNDDLTICSHPNCSQVISKSQSHLTGKGYLCSEHFRESYTVCCECHKISPILLAVPVNGQYLCEDCFTQKYFICLDCQNTYLNSDKHLINYRGSTREICPQCAKNYIRCTNCGELIRKHDIKIFNYTVNGRMQKFIGCSECVTRDFQMCSHCGNYFPKASGMKFFQNLEGNPSDQICERCHYGDNLIYSYSFKPKPHFYKESTENSTILFGVENEIELIDNRKNEERSILLSDGSPFSIGYRYYIASQIEKFIPDFIYQKHDGSLDFGIEMVSHPATLEFWLKQAKKINSLFEWLKSENCEGEDAPKAGMHVHITRTQMNLAHRNSMNAFVHGNQDFIQFMGGRRANHYSQLVDLTPEDRTNDQYIYAKTEGKHDRYQAVNWNNSNTVEIRIFQSTLGIEKFLANIEFCSALYNFTKERSTAECLSDNAVDDFRNWADGKFKFLQPILSLYKPFEQRLNTGIYRVHS